jgi:preprotein translocase subunit SecF
MEFFRIRRDIPFMRHALVFNVISLLTFLAAVFFLATRGLHFSIEFTGGTVIETAYAQPADIPKVRAAVEGLGLGDVLVQNFGSSRDVLIRVPLRGDIKKEDLVARVFAELCKAEGGTVTARAGAVEQGQSASRQACVAAGASGDATAEPVRLSRSEFVGPQVGKELAEDGAKALAFVVVGIMIYLALRFEWKFSVAAIVANLHDVIIILGFFAFFQWEFSLSVLAAVLAVLGYSVNESVVIFDRIRETFRRFRKLDTHEVIDHAITSTISRTIITHGSTQMMVLSMLIFGGPDPALLRHRADDRHPVRHLLVRVRRRRDRDVAGRQA